ncbi:hypothetical protein DI09_514p10 [Mitosporidium daphniae]|uniref:Uncharacterized protein n=1 Tax=Mitosporidium daphniae TaxID=1485682 RepID=A0A098VPG6_9MICR|nr:hypothetical protein DI09_514p10 [Mitosporidium daphniae]|eukprot:XP_013237329.1 uncharacterized protein DI09_514p10 [Mitosporidium daphniae]
MNIDYIYLHVLLHSFRSFIDLDLQHVIIDPAVIHLMDINSNELNGLRRSQLTVNVVTKATTREDDILVD